MRILFVPSDNNRYSGAFLCMVKLIAILKQKYNHEIKVVLPRKGTGKELLDAEGIDNVTIRSYDWVLSLKYKDNFLCYLLEFAKSLITRWRSREIVKIIKDEHIDIVHANTVYTYVGSLAAIKTHTTLVWHIREFLEEDQGRTLHNKKWAYKLMSMSDSIITVSKSVHDKYAPLLGREKTCYIYEGLDENEYLNLNHEILKGKTIQLLSLGEISEGKGQKQAIYAAIALHQKGYDIKLRLVGKGTKRFIDELKAIVFNNTADSYIEFCGSSNHTQDYYNSSDIFLMCSRCEAFGRVTVEAMLGGCIVVGNETGGTKDLITNGVTGLLYHKDNLESLVSQIEYVINNKEKAASIAKAGQEYMSKNMTAEKNADEVNALYNRIMNR